MKHFTIALLLFFTNTSLVNAQQNKEEDAIKATINLLFDGMRNADTTAIAKTFAPTVIMQTIAKTKEGKFMVQNGKSTDFLNSIAKPHPEKYDERIEFIKILIDNNLASVWTNYKFYVGEKFSHCGVNSFQLFKSEEGWKIVYLIDTRRKDNCN